MAYKHRKRLEGEEFKILCACGNKFVKYSSFDKQCPSCQRKSHTSQQRPQKNKVMSKPTVRQKALRTPKQIVRKKKAAKKRKKAKTIAQLVEQAAVLLQKLRRLEECDTYGYVHCVSCGKYEHQKYIQGGHWIGRGKTIVKLAHWNVNPQCPGCNYPANLYADQQYQSFMAKKYGQEFIDAALIRATQPIKYTREEINEIIEIYKEEISKYENIL